MFEVDDVRIEVGDFVCGKTTNARTIEDVIWWQVVEDFDSENIRVKPAYVGRNVAPTFREMIQERVRNRDKKDVSRRNFFRKATKEESELLELASWEPI